MILNKFNIFEMIILIIKMKIISNVEEAEPTDVPPEQSEGADAGPGRQPGGVQGRSP